MPTRISIPNHRSKSKSAQLRQWAEEHNAVVLTTADAGMKPGMFPTQDGIAASKIFPIEEVSVADLPSAVDPLTYVECYNATAEYKSSIPNVQ